MNEKDRYENPEEYAADKLRRHVDATAALAEHVRTTGRGGSRAAIEADMRNVETATAHTGTRQAWQAEGRSAEMIRADYPHLMPQIIEIAQAKNTTVEAVSEVAISAIEDGKRHEYQTRTIPFANVLRFTFRRKADRDRAWDLLDQGADAETFSRAALTPEEIAAIDAAGLTAVQALAKVGKLEATDYEAATMMGMGAIEYAIHYNRMEDK